MYKKNLYIILMPFLSILYILFTILFILAISPFLLKYLFSGKHSNIKLINDFEKLVKKTSKIYNQKIGLLLISNISIIIFSLIYSSLFTYNTFFESIIISFSLSFLTVFVFMLYWNIKHVYTKYYYANSLKSLSIRLPDDTRLDLEKQKIEPLNASNHKNLEILEFHLTEEDKRHIEHLAKSAKFIVKTEGFSSLSGGNLISDIKIKL